MIPAFVVGVLIGAIIGAAAVAWRHASTIAPPMEQHVQWSVLGIGGNGKGAHYIDPHFARMLKPILEKMGMEVRL
jgi:hypothetical protein